MMRNIAPSRALVRRSYSVLQIAFVLVSAGIFFTIVGVGLFILPINGDSNDFYDVIRNLLLFFGVGLCIVGVGFAIRALTWKTENDLARFVGDVLKQFLDDKYVFIRNVNKLRLGYIDAVLVGPPGVLVFRITDMQGKFLNEGNKWLSIDKQGKHKPMRDNPTQDAVKDIKALQDYLERNNLLEVPIFGVVVFTKDHPTAQLEVKVPQIPATHLQGLHSRLQRNYFAKDRIDMTTVKAIVDILYSE